MNITEKRFGKYGGQYVPEILMPAIQELEQCFFKLQNDADFRADFENLLKNFVGRPTALTFANRLTEHLGGAQIYLKREDLAHTGAHKINNALGQALLAKHMGKKGIIAETGAGQHGVASAVAAARLGLDCMVFMGKIDMQRQEPNVHRMRLLGAEVIPVTSGTQTLKDAVNEAFRFWAGNSADQYYLLGSALGPFPYPLMVREFQSVIGMEARRQMLEQAGRLPGTIIACVGGGSNAIGMFHAFVDDSEVKLIGVEAGGLGIETHQHAARFADNLYGRPGILHGSYSWVLQDENGQIMHTHSISAGLDYASVGPEHAALREEGRASYTYATDQEALEAFHLLSHLEGILPALESSHALAHAVKIAPKMDKSEIILVNLSGRGDKDLHIIQQVEKGVKHA